MKKVLPVLHRRVNVGLYESVDPAPAHPETTKSNAAKKCRHRDTGDAETKRETRNR